MKSKGRRRRHDERVPRWVLIFGLAMLGLFATLIVQAIRQHDRNLRWEAKLTGGPLPLASGEWDPNWPALPELDHGPPRAMDTVRAEYAFAARRPDILKYIPCYCGCEKRGHRSNLDCYVKGWAEQGVPKWDDHAFT